jgi:glycosyltransferase involved in cell wall biosynthesis
MRPIVDLLLTGPADAISWPLGSVHVVDQSPRAIDAVLRDRLAASPASAWLFWDGDLGNPSPEAIERAMRLPGDVWHAGLRLGMGGLPQGVECIQPIWMLNRDPDPAIEASSWRLSFRACLARASVLRAMGGPRADFATLAGAALETGCRWVLRGVLTRHIPWLAPAGATAAPPVLPFEDEVRFLHFCFGPLWTRWALARMALTGRVRPLEAFRAAALLGRPGSQPPAPYHSPARHEPAPSAAPRVSVLIPTIDRYPYLRKLLPQLASQTVPPLEVIVVDQTPATRRDETLEYSAPGLPLRILRLDRSGQCTSRNAGLALCRGDAVLFLDDDDEIPADLIERHIQCLASHGADVSAGVADEAGAGPLPAHFTFTRLSDVFPTNNAMVRRQALEQSGLFDLAYDRGQRADGDLGMRLYLSGAVMVLHPGISVFHHHAPQGGLRTHKARRVTYASSRRSLIQRHLPSATEVYLAARYFSPRAMREMIAQRIAGSFAVSGGLVRKLLKLAASTFLLPATLWTVRRNYQTARAMLQRFPQIPRLNPVAADARYQEQPR